MRQAGGGVGTYAVQIAAALGTEVTAVCSARNAELVRSLGTTHVIDYASEDLADGQTRYDVILDSVSNLPLTRLRRALTARATLVLNGGGSPGQSICVLSDAANVECHSAATDARAVTGSATGRRLGHGGGDVVCGGGANMCRAWWMPVGHECSYHRRVAGARWILHVETNLGLRPGGVERLGAVLLELGLAERVGAKVAGRLRAPAFDEHRDPVLGARNVHAAAALAIEQADRVGEILDNGGFPVVLGGDDSVLFGCLLALRRRGTAGLVFLDAHTDYWDLPDGTGELSDSDLWIVTGHGPDVIADLEGLRPLVRPEACVVYGHRDRAAQREAGSRDVYTEPMLVRNLGELRAAGIGEAASHAAAFLSSAGADRVWLHLDADCLDDELMPAVDWRVGGGLSATEVVSLARPLVQRGLITGMDVTIYNPSLDSADLAAGRVLLGVVAEILA